MFFTTPNPELRNKLISLFLDKKRSVDEFKSWCRHQLCAWEPATGDFTENPWRFPYRIIKAPVGWIPQPSGGFLPAESRLKQELDAILASSPSPTRVRDLLGIRKDFLLHYKARPLTIVVQTSEIPVDSVRLPDTKFEELIGKTPGS